MKLNKFCKKSTQKLIVCLDSMYHNKGDSIQFHHNQYDEDIHMGYPNNVPQGAQEKFDS